MWTIPLAHVAGVLAVTYTTDAHAGAEVVAPPQVQRPGPPALPPDDAPPVADPDPPAPTEPDAELPAPIEPAPSPADDAAAPVDPRWAEPATDDEPPPIAAPPMRTERLLRPTDRAGFFSLSVGGATGTSPYTGYLGGGMDFQWEMAIGSHSRRWPRFGGAFVFQQRKGFLNELTFAGRLLWDVPMSDAFAIYSSINFDFGANVPIGYAGYVAAYAAIYSSAVLGLGWSLKAILGERWLVSLRPIAPNIVAPAWFAGGQIPVALRWDVMGGLGVVW